MRKYGKYKIMNEESGGYLCVIHYFNQTCCTCLKNMYSGVNTQPGPSSQSTDGDLDLVTKCCTVAAHCSSIKGWVKSR